MLTAAPMAGCSGPKAYRYEQPDAEVPVSPAVRTVAGDWDDIDAALKASFARCRVATLEREDVVDDEAFDPADPPSVGIPLKAIRLEVLTMTGKTGTVLIDRGELAEDGRSHLITITSRIGPTGDAATEACLNDSIADRLGQLRGRLYAPLRWSD